MSDDKNPVVEVGVRYADVKDKHPVPDGRYTLRVAEVTSKQARSGNRLIIVSCEIVSPPKQPAPPGKDWTNKANIMLTISEKSMYQIKNFCDAVGVQWAGTTLPTAQFVGKTFMANAKNEIYEGRAQNKWDAYGKLMAAGAAAPKPA